MYLLVYFAVLAVSDLNVCVFRHWQLRSQRFCTLDEEK